MIYTLTCNPSLDYIAYVKDFREGETNRTVEEAICPGGKGINVSMVLNNLGHESTALGFMAGFTGMELQRLLEEAGVFARFISVERGATRINVKISSDKETEINGMGPAVSKDELQRLFEQLDELDEDDILVIAGSIPAELPDSLYRDIACRMQEKGVRLVVDAEKNSLLKTLPYHPFLIKPNKTELEAFFGDTIKNKKQAVGYAYMLQEMGAENVIVSLGQDGAVCVTKNGMVYKARAPKGELVSSVGAGDSMVAGFLAGFLDSGSYEEAFWTGICAGSATAFSQGLATKEGVMDLLDSFMEHQE